MFGPGKLSSNFANVFILLVGISVIGALIERDMKNEIIRNRDVSRQMLDEARLNHIVVENNSKMLNYLVDIVPATPRGATRPWRGY